MTKFTPIFALISALTLLACSGNGVDRREKSTAQQANSILGAMTLEEKIGQVIQADISAVTPDDLRTYNLGSVLNGGNSAPGGGKTAPPEEWIALADAFWLASTDKSDGGVGIPALWGTDAVHGHNNLQTATIFPHNSALGATHNPDLLKKIGAVTASEVRATGIDWTFAPTLAVAKDDRWGRAYESYSENPDIVAKYSTSMVLGLQGDFKTEDFLKGEHVIATAKHFIGDGGTQFGIDKGDTIGDVDTLLKTHGAGYAPAFAAHVQTVMASFSSINGEKMHGSKFFLTEVLRDKMGFDGFVVGDWEGHGEVPGCTNTDCVQALEAGVDMYMASNSWKGLHASLLRHAKDGTLDLARLDEAVTRILKVKIRSGQLEAGLPSKRASADPAKLGSPMHLAIARQAVIESLVLLKHENKVLPINPGQTVLVAGSGADSMQQQTGGWTLNWQGDNNSNEDFQRGETIFAGIKSAMAAHGGTAVLSEDGSFETKPDVAVVVFGEQPYAEYRGDRSDLVFEFQDGENLALIRALKAKDIPVVSVFLTGRPLWVNPHLNASDAFVVGWLPGSEGGGVADVLVAKKDGTPHHDFKGRLSFSWPNDGTATPINAASDAGVLYPYGYGLTYSSSKAFTKTSEDAGIDESANFDGVIIADGGATDMFSLYLGDSSNWNTPAMALASSSLGGHVVISGTDYKAQEDARTVKWDGAGRAVLSVRAKRPIDLTQLGDPNNLAVDLQWRLDDPVEGPLVVSMDCGEGCSSSVDVAPLLTKTPEDQWGNSEIPLRCFIKNGLDPTDVTTAIKVSSKTKAQISLYAVTIEKADEPQALCPSSAQ